MKKRFTLSALAALALGSFGAQAQFTVDGTLSPAEVGTGVGKYQLLGTYTNTHSVTDRGLMALYMGTTATTVNFMVVASPEQAAYSALVLYVDMPNKTGIAAGTQLPYGADGSSQFGKTRPTLDMPADYGFRLTASPLNGTDLNSYHSVLDLTVPLNGAGKASDIYLGSTNKTGTAFIVTDPTSGVLGAKISFKGSATGSVAANTTTGWETEYPLSVLGGAATNDIIRVIAAYVADNGEFSTDVLPQITGRTTMLGLDPNFTTIPGNQFYSYRVGSGPLATQAATAALQAAAYPNPVAAASRLTYTVSSGTQPVAVDVYNSLGQKAFTLLNDTQGVGSREVSLAPLQQLAAGSYLVTLRVGSQLSTHRVVVE